MPKKDRDGFLCNSSAELFSKFHSIISAEIYGKQWKNLIFNQEHFDCMQGTCWSSETLINVDRVQMAMIFQVQLEFVDIIVGSNVSLHVSWMHLNNNYWQTTNEKPYSAFIKFIFLKKGCIFNPKTLLPSGITARFHKGNQCEEQET